MRRPLSAGDWTALAELYGLGYGCFGSSYCFGYGGYYPPEDWYLEPGGGGGGSSDTTHGLVVNGRGYTRVQPREPDRAGSGSRSGGDGSTSSGSSDGGSASSAGSSSASPAGYSGGGGTSTGLTAVPR